MACCPPLCSPWPCSSCTMPACTNHHPGDSFLKCPVVFHSQPCLTCALQHLQLCAQCITEPVSAVQSTLLLGYLGCPGRTNCLVLLLCRLCVSDVAYPLIVLVMPFALALWCQLLASGYASINLYLQRLCPEKPLHRPPGTFATFCCTAHTA